MGPSSAIRHLIPAAALAIIVASCSGDITDPEATEVLNDTTGLYLKPLERVGNGVNSSAIISVDTAQAGNTISVRAVIRNPTTHSGSVDCAITADPMLQASAVGSTSSVSVPANSTAYCQYTVAAPGIGAFPISVNVTPAPGSPVGFAGAVKSTSATLRVIAGGKFSAFDISAMDVQQSWFNRIGNAAFPAESLSLQQVRIAQLSLFIVPTQDVIGTFSLKGTVTSGSTTFPSGTVTGTLRRSSSGVTCNITAGPNAQFTGAPTGFPTGIGYFADVCAEPDKVNGVGGFQRVSIDYVQSLANPLMNPGAYLLTGTVTVKIELSFTLQGSSTPDKATATVTIPVSSPLLRPVTNFEGTRAMWTAQTSSPPAVATP